MSIVGDKMKTWIIIGIIIIFIIFATIVFIKQYHRFQRIIIKLKKAEKSIFKSLDEKHDVLSNYYDYLKENTSFDEEIKDNTLINANIDINLYNQEICDLNNVINNYLDNNEKLLKKKEILNYNRELLNVNIALNGQKNYYNNNLIKYNHLLEKFPSNIVGKLLKYPKKDLIPKDIDESFKILE